MKGWDVLRKERYQRQIASGLIDRNWNLPARPKEVPAWESLTKKQKIKYDDMMAIYAAMMEEVDKNIGKLVSALTERKLLDNTLILFFSDNGGNAEAGISGKYIGENPGDPHSNVFIGRCWAELNNTPFRKYKHYNHEGGTSTPLIAHWPQGIKKERIKSGKRHQLTLSILWPLALILVRQSIQNKETAPKFTLTLERASNHYSLEIRSKTDPSFGNTRETQRFELEMKNSFDLGVQENGNFMT